MNAAPTVASTTPRLTRPTKTAPTVASAAGWL